MISQLKTEQKNGNISLKGKNRMDFFLHIYVIVIYVYILKKKTKKLTHKDKNYKKNTAEFSLAFMNK